MWGGTWMVAGCVGGRAGVGVYVGCWGVWGEVLGGNMRGGMGDSAVWGRPSLPLIVPTAPQGGGTAAAGPELAAVGSSAQPVHRA